MASRDRQTRTRFQEKLERELRSGLVTILLLLVVERTGPTYGYRILATIKEASDDRLAFKEGTAYPLLNNLEKLGLIDSYWGTGDGGPPRKYYQATALGRDALDDAMAEWQGLLSSVDRLIQTLGSEFGPATKTRAAAGDHPRSQDRPTPIRRPLRRRPPKAPSEPADASRTSDTSHRSDEEET